MRDGVAAVGCVKEEHARLAVVMRLLDDLLEQVACFDCTIGADGHARGFSLFKSPFDVLAVTGIMHVGEAQFPFSIILDGLHEGIRDADRNVEIGNVVLVGLAGDEIINIGMVYA